MLRSIEAQLAYEYIGGKGGTHSETHSIYFVWTTWIVFVANQQLDEGDVMSKRHSAQVGSAMGGKLLDDKVLHRLISR